MMDTVNRSVKVSVAGVEFALRTTAKPKYVKELANLVSARMDEVRGTGRSVSTQSLALLAAMNIADELLQLRESHRLLKQQVREKSERILRYLDREAEI